MYTGDGGKSHIRRRFRYHTVFGKSPPQEGSGEPIHLAASMNDLPMVQWLLERNAEIKAYVTRDHQDHYQHDSAAVDVSTEALGRAHL